MRYLLLIIVLVTSGVTSAREKKAAPTEHLFLSAAEFLKLDPRMQDQYIDYVRVFLFKIEEATGGNFGPDSDKVSTYKRLLEAITLPQAHADLSMADPSWSPTQDIGTKQPRCLYAGFVIYTSSCSAQNSVKIKMADSTSDYKPTHEITVSCPAGKVLCNPFVFGLNSDNPSEGGENAKNFSARCIGTPSDKRNTTRECYYAARGDKSAKQVVAANRGMWDSQRISLDNMCNKESLNTNYYFKNRTRAKKDVGDTCAWAHKRIIELGLYHPSNLTPDTNETVPDSRHNSYSPMQDNQHGDERRNESEVTH